LELVTYEALFAIWSVAFYGKRFVAPIVTAEAIALRPPPRFVVALWLLPCAVTGAYLPRSEYFTRSPTIVVVMLASAFAIAAYYVFKEKRLVYALLAGMVALITGAGGIWLAIYQEPTRETVRQLIAEGRPDEALEQLYVLGFPDDKSLDPLVDDVTALRALDECCDCRAVASTLISVTSDSPLIRQARALADKRALETARKYVGRPSDAWSDDTDGALRELECASPAARASPEGRAIQIKAHQNRGERCLARRDAQCALAEAELVRKLGIATDLRERALVDLRRQIDGRVDEVRTYKSPDMRIVSARKAVEAWDHYISLEPTPEPKAMKALRVQLARDEATEAARVAAAERERKRQADLAAEARQRSAEAEAKKAEAAAKNVREEITRFGADASILCCDGTLSPTCTCGGSRLGCCEKHGGVCGCQ
ncbi:MAG TPA: hypothetical protein VIV11_20950, partial [Kofleriaceae bacterium]